jgi:hypothetical protein
VLRPRPASPPPAAGALPPPPQEQQQYQHQQQGQQQQEEQQQEQQQNYLQLLLCLVWVHLRQPQRLKRQGLSIIRPLEARHRRGESIWDARAGNKGKTQQKNKRRFQSHRRAPFGMAHGDDDDDDNAICSQYNSSTPKLLSTPV